MSGTYRELVGLPSQSPRFAPTIRFRKRDTQERKLSLRKKRVCAIQLLLGLLGMLLFASNGFADIPSCSAICQGDGHCLLRCRMRTNCIQNCENRLTTCNGKYSCDDYRKLCMRSCHNPRFQSPITEMDR